MIFGMTFSTRTKIFPPEERQLQKHENDFNPLKPQAVCYKVMRREDLEKWLEERELIGTTPRLLSFRSQLFNGSNLDALYSRLSELQNPDLVTIQV